MSAASLVFRIVYQLVYYVLYLVLLALVIVTPADLIRQGLDHDQKINILIIALCYLVTILVVVFIYATRLYLNRTVLAAIPREYIPVEKGDVPRDVRAMIVESLSRSAALAYKARPRLPAAVLPSDGRVVTKEEEKSKKQAWISKWRRNEKEAEPEDFVGIEIPQHQPVWGEIEHPGWAAPTAPDLPNLQYETVISELPYLIEAKALTLAPPDPTSESEPPTLDPSAVALLQREESMGLREYLTHLTDLAVLAPLPTTASFLTAYEHARFSPRPLTNTQFRNLMNLFADILRNMHPLSASVLARAGGAGSSFVSSTEDEDIDDDGPNSSSQSSHGSVHLAPPGMGGSSRMRASSTNTWQQQMAFRTAPTTPKSRHTALTRNSSPDSFAHTRQPYPASQTSSASLRSGRSAGSGSVIRLATEEDETELPYVLRAVGSS